MASRLGETGQHVRADAAGGVVLFAGRCPLIGVNDLPRVATSCGAKGYTALKVTLTV